MRWRSRVVPAALCFLLVRSASFKLPGPMTFECHGGPKSTVRGKGFFVGTVFDGKQAVDQALISLVAVVESGHGGRLTGHSNAFWAFQIGACRTRVLRSRSFGPESQETFSQKDLYPKR